MVKKAKRAKSKSARKTGTKRKARPTARAGGRAAANTINAWEQDPGSGAQPTGGQLIQRPVPTLSARPLPTRIANPAAAPQPARYNAGTSQFRYWACADALRRGSDFWGAHLPGMDWQVGATLPVDLDHGTDLNAYYDRVGLRFFHGSAGGRTVYSGESPDIVCHELGHAILDSLKPQLWDAASIEIAAFHESFGDMSALLSALQVQSLRVGVLQETGNAVYRSSRLSRLAEQLGWAIRQSVPSAVEPDCLRNAVNQFFYSDPDTLPSQAPANTLSSEPHSFSRVFTAAFLEGLAGMFAARPARNEQQLLQASQDAGHILVEGIRGASVVPTFFSQVAASMLNVAATQFSAQLYEQPLRSAFVRHGILPPAMAAAVGFAAASRAMAPPPAAAAQRELPQQSLSVADYGLGVSTILVHAAYEPKRFEVAGAAAAFGAAAAPQDESTAKAFFESLLRRGRLKITAAPEKRAEIVRSFAPREHDTFTHELKRENGQVVLRRLRIDCCFGHH